MPNVKEQLREIAAELPSKATLGDALEKIYFRIQVEKGLAQLDAGKSISHDEMKRRVASWAPKRKRK